MNCCNVSDIPNKSMKLIQGNQSFFSIYMVGHLPSCIYSMKERRFLVRLLIPNSIQYTSFRGVFKSTSNKEYLYHL